MNNKSVEAMQEAVENSLVVLAVITGDGPGDGPDDKNAYLSRDFCLRELRWAFKKGTHVQPVVDLEDKKRIGEFTKMAPADLKRIGSIDFVDLNPSDKEYWDVGLKKIFDKAKARRVFPQGRSSTRRPSTVEHRSLAAVAPEPADGAVEPASGESLGANTEPVSEEPVAPMVAPLDGEIEELQLGTAENDIPELKDSDQ